MSELRAALDKMNRKEAAGPDGIVMFLDDADIDKITEIIIHEIYDTSVI